MTDHAGIHTLNKEAEDLKIKISALLQTIEKRKADNETDMEKVTNLRRFHEDITKSIAFLRAHPEATAR